jgi:hypothetical protein
MKKIVLSTMGAFFLTAVMFSCNQPKETEVSPTTAKAGEESLSVIDQMEKEEGVTFFKRDILFKDAKSGSEILMRFASKKRDEFEYYMTNFDYTVEPVFAGKEEELVAMPIELKNRGGQLFPDLSRSGGLITEPLRMILKDGAVGYHIYVKRKVESSSPKAKIAYQDLFWQHVSDKNPKTWKVRVDHNSGVVNTVNVGLEYRYHWYSSWQYWWPWTQYSSGSNFSITHGPFTAGQGEFNKVIARVYYDPIGVLDPQQGFDLWYQY